jgi:protein phosphatase
MRQPSTAQASLVVEYAGLTDCGPVRPHNEDHVGWGRVGSAIVDGDPARLIEADGGEPACATLDERPGQGLLFVVADGLGAYGGGDIASGLGVAALLERAASHTPGAGGRAATLLRSGFELANRTVFDAALTAEHRKMQTTMSALMLSPGDLHVGHVGDCRIYRMRGDEVELLTTDHTQLNEMMRMRLVTPEQAADHPARFALTRSLGGELIVRVDVRREPLVDGDTFLLCSDGMWGKVDIAEIQLLMAEDLSVGCQNLVSLAIERGGEDNITALLVRIHRAGTSTDRPSAWRRLLRAR